MSARGRWDYLVCGYYADDVKAPKVPGELALEVGVRGESARDLEASIFEGRSDIGEVVVINARSFGA